MLKDRSSSLNWRLVGGWALVSIGVACNEWTLTKAFSADGVLELTTRIDIYSFNIAFIFAGSFLIRCKESLNPREIFRRLTQTHPTIVALSIGMIFAGLMLLCAEGMFYFLNSYRQPHISTQRSGEFYLPDELLGYKPTPKKQVSVIKRKDGRPLYNVTYSTDQFSRRLTPIKKSGRRENFILFFGCSYMFGEGLNDDETLPFYVSALAPEYRSYNYGYSGYGPQNMLAKLQSGEISKEVNETHGIAIYTFINNHISRAIGSMSVVTTWGGDLPFYTIDSHNRLVRDGSLTSGKPFLSFMYSLLAKSQIARYFRVDFPSKIDNHDIEITYRMIEESRNVFRKQFHSDDFYVLLYPGQDYARKMIPYFQSSGIKYLDYSNWQALTKAGYYIEGDGHPNGKANKAIAERLSRDLEIDRDDHQQNANNASIHPRMQRTHRSS